MKRASIALAILMIALMNFEASVSRAQSQAKSQGRISGIVRRAGTAIPVANATVRLWASDAPPESPENRENDADEKEQARLWFAPHSAAGRLTRVSFVMESASLRLVPQPRVVHERGPQPFRSAKTDRSGRFVFQDLPERVYSLDASADGYVYFPRLCAPAKRCDDGLKAGTAIDNITIDLIPTGAVSGVVDDGNRHPLPLVPVELLQIEYESDGRRTLRSVQTTLTDDRGRYRFHNVNPGRYHVAAGTPPGQAPQDGRVAINGVRARPVYKREYHPDVTEVERAAPIDLLPGAEAGDRNFSLTRVVLRRIRGRIVDSATGRPPATASIAFRSMDVPDPAGRWPATLSVNVTYDGKTGAFELRGMLNGRYTLIATPRADAAKAAAPVAIDTAAYAVVQIAAADVDEVTLSLAPGASIAGRITVEGGTLAAALTFASIRLHPMLGGSDLLAGDVPDIPIQGSTASFNSFEPARLSVPLQPDGRFQIDNMRPGEYRLQASQLSSGAYIKDVRFGGAEAFERPMAIAGPGVTPIDIVLGFTTARVSGQVSDSRTPPEAGTLVILAPDRLRLQPERVLTTRLDSDGRFSFNAVPPGDYRAFVWTGQPPNAFYNPDFLRGIEGYGVPVRVAESGSTTLTLRPIPLNP